MTKSRTNQQLFTAFIDQLKIRNRINIVPFDKRRWFRGAYSTIQRTLRDGFSPLSKEGKDACADMLFKEIPRLSGKGFDANLQSLILKTAAEFKVSIGHAQKLISILIKYAAACAVSSKGQLPEDWKSLVQSEAERLPLPIDAIVLFRLKTLYPDKFSDVLGGSGTDKKGRPTYWARVSCDKASAAWSRISDYPTYWSLQKRVRDLASADRASPLEFEMRHLWVAE